MNSQNFFKNLALAKEAMKEYNFSEENKYKFALELSLRLEELDLQVRKMSLEEEQIKQQIELNYLEAKNKFISANAEQIKGLIQSSTMIKSVWDNANINKINALIGLFNSITNAQNISNLKDWRVFFEEIKNAAFAIGNDIDSKGNTNELVKNYEPLVLQIGKSLEELSKTNKGIKEVMILYPKLELVLGESIVLRGFVLFETKEYGFLIEGKSIKSFSYLFEAKELGSFDISFFALKEREKIIDSIKINVTQT